MQPKKRKIVLLNSGKWVLASELASELGIPAREEHLNRYDVYTADEAFFTGTASELVPIRMVDGREIGSERPGPATLKLQAAFRALVHRAPG